MNTFEQSFADTERAAEAVAKSSSALATAAKQLERAAAEGDIAAIRKTSERLSLLIEAACQDVCNARSAWPFTPETEEAYLRADFDRELVEVARTAGLQILRLDEALVAFPSILRVLPDERVVQVDRKKLSTLRPSKLVEILKAIRSKKPDFSSERFLEALYSAYRLLVGRDAFGEVVALASVYQAFTLLPGLAAEYDQNDFSRDLFLLNRSGLTQTKSGARFSFPAATGTKGRKGKYLFASPDGEIVTFYGIRFTGGV